MRPSAAGDRDRPLGVADGERDRLLDQQVLAALGGADGELGVELRRQRHDDGIDVGSEMQLVGIDRQAFLLAGEALGARAIGVRNRIERVERLERANVVAAPIAATEDGDTRFHQSQK